MKKLIAITFAILIVCIFHTDAFSQEKYGNSLNIGLGIGGYSGYYKYTARALAVFNINYEFDVAKNFTLAPFISFSSYSDRVFWEKNNTYYHYPTPLFLLV